MKTNDKRNKKTRLLIKKNTPCSITGFAIEAADGLVNKSGTFNSSTQEYLDTRGMAGRDAAHQKNT